MWSRDGISAPQPWVGVCMLAAVLAGSFNHRLRVSAYAYAAAARVNFPMYNGSNPKSWLTRIEQYFYLHNTPDTRKMDALVATEGDASPRQFGSVSDYVTTYIARLVHVPGLAEPYCLGVFSNGLREEMHLKIGSHEARTLPSHYSLGQRE